MRFRHRTTIIILLLAVCVTVGASMLFAAPNADVDRDDALEALAVLNRYFEQPATVPVVDKPAQPNPSSIPVEITCDNPGSGELAGNIYVEHYRGVRVVRQAALHFELVFINPDTEPWYYGIKLREYISDSSSNPSTWGIEFRQDGTWVMNTLKQGMFHDRLVDSGTLKDYGVPFPTESGAKNRLSFYTQTPDSAYRLFINGVEVPIPFADILPQGEYERYRHGRAYYIIGKDKRQQDGGVFYEGLCTQESWRSN